MIPQFNIKLCATSSNQPDSGKQHLSGFDINEDNGIEYDLTW